MGSAHSSHVGGTSAGMDTASPVLGLLLEQNEEKLKKKLLKRCLVGFSGGEEGREGNAPMKTFYRIHGRGVFVRIPITYHVVPSVYMGNDASQ